jgi:hypothetical protein
MSFLGSDIVALGCIIGSAAVGGAVTLAVMDSGEDAHFGCGVESVAVSPTIAISSGGEARAIVVAPDVRVRKLKECGSSGVVHVHVNRHVDAHLEHLDAQLEHLDEALEIQMEQLEHQLEHQLEAQIIQEIDVQARMEEALSRMEDARIRVRVKRAESGGI